MFSIQFSFFPVRRQTTPAEKRLTAGFLKSRTAVFLAEGYGKHFHILSDRFREAVSEKPCRISLLLRPFPQPGAQNSFQKNRKLKHAVLDTCPPFLYNYFIKNFLEYFTV